MLNHKIREARRFREDPPASSRTVFERDCDRILYSTAFRRLANVTQVVAADQGTIFHNRLTHALKVAQLGRRLAQQMTISSAGRELADSLGGLNPDVVEAAGLAHDLGHPPFGHLSEAALDHLVTTAGVPGGYEGNAQAFRIVTKLATRSEDDVGLNLTRATLNAILKYPWQRSAEGKQAKKWGAYHSEEDDFTWTRRGINRGSQRTLEAEIMDFADDIAYSIFDLEDFYKAGKVPLERLSSGTDLFYSEVDSFMQGAFARWKDNGDPPDNEEAYVRAFLEICNFFPARPYSGTRVERAFLRDMTSVFVARYVGGIQMVSNPNKKQSSVAIEETHRREIRLLKELTWFYVINNPALATQQHGYRHVIKELFNAFLDAGLGGKT